MKIHRKDFRGNWVILTKLHRPVCIFDRHTPEWTGNRRENCIFAVTNFRIAEKEKRRGFLFFPCVCGICARNAVLRFLPPAACYTAR